MGAFTSVDPVLGVGGSTGWNGYLYANGNPANLVDPAGTCVDPLSFIVCAVVGGAIIGGTTAAAYDVFVNQGFGGENLFRRNLSEVDWERARRVEAIGAGIGAVTAASALFVASQVSGLIAASVQHGVYSLGFTQAAHAAMWNIGGTLVMDSLAYHGLSGYVETGGVDVGALLREESHNPILAGMFLADFGFSAYTQFQAYGGLLALRARLPRLLRNPFSGPSRQLTMRELDLVVGGSGNESIVSQLEGLSEDARERILFRIIRGDRKGRPFGTPSNPRTPTIEEFNPHIIDVYAGELENSIIARKHGIFPDQASSIRLLSNESLIRFRIEDPISATGGLRTLSLTGGHHRTAEIINRVNLGQMSPETIIRILLHD